MSATITIDGETNDPGTQHQPVAKAGPAIAIEDAPGSGPSDAEAIRAAQAALAAKDQELSAARNHATAATTDAARARDEAARMARGRVQDQRATLAATIEAADTDIARAKTALRTAGEAGDFDAMGTAQEQISAATYRKNSAQGDLAKIGEAPTGDGQQRQQQMQAPQQQQPNVMGPRSRQWVTEHPRMDTDPVYRGTAVGAHNQAVAQGYTVESDEYFAHINRVMDATYGGNGGQNGGHAMAQQRGNDTSSAAPSNRGGGGQNGGWKVVKTGLGQVSVAENNGRMRISFPDASVRDNMDEGAKICYPTEYAKDPVAALAMYTGEQIKIAREQDAGGNAGLIIGEGRSYA